MLQRLFVYGTLAPGRPNAHVLADVPGTWEPARMAGRLVQEGWGAALGYPAIVPGAGEGFVEGQLFSSEVLDAHWRRLDAFEGEAYVRVLAPALRADGTTVQAHVYAIREPSPRA